MLKIFKFKAFLPVNNQVCLEIRVPVKILTLLKIHMLQRQYMQTLMTHWAKLKAKVMKKNRLKQ